MNVIKYVNLIINIEKYFHSAQKLNKQKDNRKGSRHDLRSNNL
jgi:hypothetical protein